MHLHCCSSKGLDIARMLKTDRRRVRMRDNMKIAIVGGGIGGLTTALAMTQAGFAVTVYERAAKLTDQGAGITLAPNATRVLYHLGLGPELEETAVTPPMTEYR